MKGNDVGPTDWTQANQTYLLAALAQVRAALLRHVGLPAPEHDLWPGIAAAGQALPAPAALETLCATFGLSSFERDILLLCAGVEFDATFAPLCAAAQGDPQRNYPTFSLALAALPDPAWDALSPVGPLRHWQLIEIEPGRTLAGSPLRIDERILHYLLGVTYLDARLDGLLRPLTARHHLAPSLQRLADELAVTWSTALENGPVAALHLVGPQAASKQAVAAAVCARLGLSLYIMPAATIPGDPAAAQRLLRRWEREAVLSNSALLLDGDEIERSDTARAGAPARLVEAAQGLLILSSRERWGPWQRPVLSVDVARPGGKEQQTLWESVLGHHAGSLNGHIERLVAQFDLDLPAMATAWTAALGRLATGGDRSPTPDSTGRALWDVCRAQVRPQLDDLALRIEPAAAWEDLVLPPAQTEILREIAMHVRGRTHVYERWGFAGKGSRGLGISALFSGLSGTGKTMAAEVLARELRLDLYRIDLSSVVSKYIGETEKNLRRVFDAAETAGALLLFDEADALFGKRSEVKDSHDRYANIEVGYLLQRMESYRGLAILTSNLKDALDDAFLRRIRFVVQFPFPDAAQRAEIWRRIFPLATPTAELDVTKLARLNVTGGNIRNIALHAAFLAADAGQAVGMSHLLRAARREYEKLERPLTDFEIREWV